MGAPAYHHPPHSLQLAVLHHRPTQEHEPVDSSKFSRRVCECVTASEAGDDGVTQPANLPSAHNRSQGQGTRQLPCTLTHHASWGPNWPSRVAGQKNLMNSQICARSLCSSVSPMMGFLQNVKSFAPNISRMVFNSSRSLDRAVLKSACK